MSNDHDDRPVRDANGRWIKGHCPNPKGRPRKKVQADYNPGDLQHFGYTLIEVMAGGQKETMDRRAALLHKMYESAMKGRGSMQRFLYKEFERNAERLAAARVRYNQLMTEWVIENPDFRGLDDENIPFNIQLEIAGLGSLLNHYFPGQYPSHRRSASEDDADGGDV